MVLCEVFHRSILGHCIFHSLQKEVGLPVCRFVRPANACSNNFKRVVTLILEFKCVQSYLSVSRFDGRVVAKLPFEPFSLLRGISHRNLMGSDATDCSFIFLYILCTMSIREVRLSVCLSVCVCVCTVEPLLI